MLTAHLAPGYAAAVLTQPAWDEHWTRSQRAVLWGIALGSTVAPDVDVIYNTLLRGFTNHSTLWTHSIFPYLALCVVWLVLGWVSGTRQAAGRGKPTPLRKRAEWAAVVRMGIALAALGGFSHLALDMIAHNTPIWYPLSDVMVGIAPEAVVEGGLRAYVTHPLMAAVEVALLAIVAVHWWRDRRRKMS